jgi:hypothetical protein
MKRIHNPHLISHITINKERPPSTEARLGCGCGAVFYGPDRLTVLDTHTGHLIESHSLDVFKLLEAQA